MRSYSDAFVYERSYLFTKRKLRQKQLILFSENELTDFRTTRVKLHLYRLGA